MRTAIAVAGPPATAAVLGNAFIGKDSMRWFRELRAPRLQLPMAAFGVVGAAYYAARSFRRQRQEERSVTMVDAPQTGAGQA